MLFRLAGAGTGTGAWGEWNLGWEVREWGQMDQQKEKMCDLEI